MASSVSYVKVSWSGTPTGGTLQTGTLRYSANSYTGCETSPWSQQEGSNHKCIQGRSSTEYSVWVYPTSSTTKWADMVGETVMVARHASNMWRVANPAGSITSVTGTKYLHKIQSADTSQGTASDSSEIVVVEGVYMSGKGIAVTASPKEGYEFSYWGGDTSNAIIDGPKCTINLRVQSDVTVTAYFKPKTQTVSVTFMLNNNSGGYPDLNTAKWSDGSTGNKATTQTVGARYSGVPSNPTATGWTFNYWLRDSDMANLGTSVTDDTVPNANHSMWAQWTRNAVITVEFDANGGDGGTTKTGYAGNSLTAPTVTRAGYTFAGWSPSVPSTFPSSNAKYTAQWTKVYYTVTLKSNNGSSTWPGLADAGFGSSRAVETTAQLGYLDYLSGLEKPTATGYTFDYWYDDTQKGRALGVYAYTSAHTFWAQWTANTYTLTFYPQNGGTTFTKTATYGQTMPSISSPSRTGYDFTGYYYVPRNGDVVQYYTASGASARAWNLASSADLYAGWTAKTTNITFDKQNGSGGTDSTTATYGAAMPKIDVPSRSNYLFNGYYDGVSSYATQYYNSSGNSVRDWDKEDSSARLYARWTYDPPPTTYYTLTFDKEGGSGGTDSLRKSSGSLWGDITVPERTGYWFGGYFEDLDQTTLADRFYDEDGKTDQKARASLVLHALWVARSFVLSLEQEGGVGGESSVSVYYDQDLPTIETLPTREGYTFGGYYEDRDGQGRQYFSASGAGVGTWTETQARPLYAYWTHKTRVLLSSEIVLRPDENVDAETLDAVRPSLKIGDGGTPGATAGELVDMNSTVTLIVPAETEGLVFSHFTGLPEDTSVEDDGNGSKRAALDVGSEKMEFSITANYNRKEVAASALYGDNVVPAPNLLSVDPPATTRRFGDVVTFKADVPSASDYEFYGWSAEETATEEILPGGNMHETVLAGDTVLYAHYGRRVKFAVESYDKDGAASETAGGSIAIKIFGADATEGALSADGLLVPAGASVRLTAMPAEPEEGAEAFRFAGVYFTPAIGAKRGTEYAAEADIVPAEAGTYTVEFRQNPPWMYLACADVAEEGASGAVGSTVATYGGTDDDVFEETDWASVEAELAENNQRFYNIPSETAESARWYKVRRGTNVELSATRARAVPNILAWKSVEYRELSRTPVRPPSGAGGDGEGGEPEVQPAWVERAHTVTDDVLVTTTWGRYASPKVTLRAQGPGSVKFAGEAASLNEKEFPPATEESGSEIVYTYQTATVLAVFDANAGVVFDGWIVEKTGAVVSTSPEYAFEVNENTVLTAKFHVEANVLYEWEGSGQNKTMEWQSGAIEMPRPCDPVAVRVDAAGYPVEMSVGTYSSPDEDPVRQHAVSVAEQSARRVPRMRPERFWRMSVKSAVEVDALVAATNIAEAN